MINYSINILKIKQIFFYIFLLFLLLSINNCKDSAIDVYANRSPFEYNWTTDTLHLERNFQTLMFSMWASSISDLYTVGHSDGTRGAMWKYDGKNWDNIKLSFIEGGQLKDPSIYRQF